MPFKSKSQRRWMYANKPRMAKKWEKHTPDDADLPEKKDKEAELADGQGIDMFTEKQAEAAMERYALGMMKLAVQEFESGGLLKSPVTSTIGRVGNLPQALALGTTKGVLDTSDIESMKELIEAYERGTEEDIEKKREEAKERGTFRKVLDWSLGTGPEGQGELMVTAGGTKPIRNLGRVWSRPGIGLPGRVLGTVGSPINDLLGALTRGDHYNPWAHSVSSFTKEPAVQAHELGHAKDYAEKNWPTLYGLSRLFPPAAIYQEYAASKNAMKLLRKAALKAKLREVAGYDDKRTNRLLSGGMSSYVGKAVHPSGALPGALIGQAIGHSQKPWGSAQSPDDDEDKEKGKKAASDQAFLALRAYDRHTSGRKFAQELKKARAELGVDRNTIQALDLAEVRSRDPSELRAQGFAKAADQWLEKTAAPAWAKKLMKKRESDGKDVPEWLKKMTGDKKEQKEAMEKLALSSRLIAGLGRRLTSGSKSLPGLGQRFARRLTSGSKSLSGLGQRFGRRLGRMGGHLEAAGGLRRQIPRQIARLARRVPGVAPVEAGVRRAAGLGRRAAGAPTGAFRRMRNLFRRAPAAAGDVAGGAAGQAARRTRFPLGVGQAARYGVPAGLGFGLGAHLYGGPRESAEQQVTMDEDQPDFVKKMMGGLGQYVGEDLGLESLGNMIQQNPYSSLGVGVGGGGLLLYLLYQLLSRRSGSQAYVPGLR